MPRVKKGGFDKSARRRRSQEDLLLDRDPSLRVELQLQSSVSASDGEHASDKHAAAKFTT